MAAASKKFVSKLGKVAFQEVGAEIKLREGCLDANDLHDLVCKKAGACGEKKNDCPKSKGDLGAALGAIAGVAHKNFWRQRQKIERWSYQKIFSIMLGKEEVVEEEVVEVVEEEVVEVVVEEVVVVEEEEVVVVEMLVEVK